MLDKLKITMIVGLVLGALRVFLPELDVPENFEAIVSGVINGVFVIVAVAMGWLKKESAAKIATLVKAP